MKFIAALVISVALTVSACSAQPPASDSTEVNASPAESPLVSADQEWQAAVATTLVSGGVWVEAQIVTNVEGFERIEMGEGYVHLPSATGDMKWTDDRATLREVRTVAGHFVELDGVWYEESQDIPTTIAFTPLAGLETAAQISRGAPEEVLGTATRRFDAPLQADARLVGVSVEELTVMDPSSGSLSATIWVDDQDRIVRILREYRTTSLDGDPIEGTALFLLSDFGSDKPIDVPETVDAIPAPA